MQAKDILYVRRGSYRIGSVAMASPYDLKCILTREIKVMRIIDSNNKYGITPEYLLYALSHKMVFEQAQNKIFIDTTLPNIAERWTELKIPVFNDIEKFNSVKLMAKDIVSQQWGSLEGIHKMKCSYDVYNT